MGLYINCSYFSTYNWYDSGQNCTKNCFITPISLRFIGDISIVNGLTTVSAWWFGTCFIFPYIGNVIIPTDELIFFRGVAQPPTSSWYGATPQKDTETLHDIWK